jgi:hypothetical protein
MKMAYRYMQVETFSCDKCGKEEHRVLTHNDEDPYPDHIEFDLFKERTEKKGWVFLARSDGTELEFCSERCLNSCQVERQDS